METFRTLLVATDFGETSEAALGEGRAVARALGAELHVIHVVHDLAVHGGEWLGSAMSLRATQADAEEAARQRLDSLVSETDRQALGARTVVVTANSIPQAILDYADEANIDLLVVGTHGRGPLGRLVMGSVAEALVRTAPCPVLTVRHPRHAAVPPEPPHAVTEV